MSTTVSKYVFLFVLLLVPATSLQAQLFGQPRLMLLGCNRTETQRCCENSYGLTLSSSDDCCLPDDPCETQRKEDERLVLKYFSKYPERLPVLMHHVRSRDDRCRRGNTPRLSCIQDPVPTAEVCWSIFEQCKITGSDISACEDQFFHCLREVERLEGPGGPTTCYVEGSARSSFTRDRCCLVKRRCTSLFNPPSRPRCR